MATLSDLLLGHADAETSFDAIAANARKLEDTLRLIRAFLVDYNGNPTLTPDVLFALADSLLSVWEGADVAISNTIQALFALEQRQQALNRIMPMPASSATLTVGYEDDACLLPVRVCVSVFRWESLESMNPSLPFYTIRLECRTHLSDGSLPIQVYAPGWSAEDAQRLVDIARYTPAARYGTDSPTIAYLLSKIAASKTINV